VIFFHNFTDGVFVGNAFVFCDRNVAYTIAGATIYHELAQELADFSLLTNTCGLKVWEALVTNFISGLSVMLGAIVIVAGDVSVHVTGIVLAFSAGVYIYIAAAECIPEMREFDESLPHHVTRGKRSFYQLLSVFCFMCGAVPIGLVLLNHSHGCA